ncbi:MAG: hypothetical protein EXQ85_01480 [Alphaproteobacteria bacterium]|nr:hypothetical protein [Alphaproteobacteria bacterium]
MVRPECPRLAHRLRGPERATRLPRPRPSAERRRGGASESAKSKNHGRLAMSTATAGARAPTKAPTLDQLVKNAWDLVPHLTAEGKATEDRRSLSAETVRKLFAAGLLRYFQPRRYGGWEMDWGTQYYIAKAIAHGCPSTAWIVSVVGQHVCHAARFPGEAQDELWANGPDVIVATSSTVKPNARAHRVKAGFIVEGSYGFSSGIDHSAWGLANGTVNGEGPERWYFMMPRKDYTIDDTWHTIGMRGTGTKDMHAMEAFVPDHRSIRMTTFNAAHPPGSKHNPSYIYDWEMGPWVHGSSPLGPVVGTAEAALKAYIEITKSRVSALTGARVADSDAVHLRLSESAAEVYAADLVARTDLQLLHERGKAGQTLSEQEKIELVRNRGLVADLCMRSLTRLVRMMGAIGIFEDNPLNRYYRDLHAMTTQVGVAFDVTMPHWGRWALGIAGKGVMSPTAGFGTPPAPR